MGRYSAHTVMVALVGVECCLQHGLGFLDFGGSRSPAFPLLALGSYVATDGRDDALGVRRVEGFAVAA